MSYLDQSRRNHPATIAAVAILHAGLGYAIISGLAYQVITFRPPVTPADIYQDPPDPPAHDAPPPPQRAARDTPVPHNAPIVQTDLGEATTIEVATIDPPTKPDLDAVAAQPARQDPPKLDLARAPSPASGRDGWVTTDDYPLQALRAGVSGTVGISVMIGPDGRVRSCAVTAASGNAQLDDASCRVYARRARFTPAIDSDGRPIAARHADRIRWQVPR